MLNTYQIGEQIAKLRQKKGLTQEQLIELIGEDKVSLSTLKRIESGMGGFSLKRIIPICDALECEIGELIDDQIKVSLKDYYSEEGEGEVLFAAEIQRLFYPKRSDHMLFQRFPITSLLQFLIYLPLMNKDDLHTCLYCIGGSAFDREYYILSKLAYLYRTIPKGDAKDYADYMANKCTYDWFKRFITDPELESELLEPENQEKLLRGYNAYMKIVEGE